MADGRWVVRYLSLFFDQPDLPLQKWYARTHARTHARTARTARHGTALRDEDLLDYEPFHANSHDDTRRTTPIMARHISQLLHFRH